MKNHPMENPSLAPFGFVGRGSRSKLLYVPSILTGINREVLIGRLWEKWNRLRSPKPIPLEHILHKIAPSLSTLGRIADGDLVFDGKSYAARDIRLLSTAVQWFGTNVGNSVLTEPLSRLACNPNVKERDLRPMLEFRTRMKRFEEDGTDLVAKWKNWIPNETKKTWTPCDPAGALYDMSKVTRRDRLIIDALMLWLGGWQGRAFIKSYARRKKRAYALKQERSRRRLECAHTNRASVSGAIGAKGESDEMQA